MTEPNAQFHVTGGALSRIVGFCNLGLAGITLASLTFTLIGFHGIPTSFFEQQAPFAPPLIRRMAIVSAVLALGLALTGVLLLKSRRRGAWLSIPFLAAECAVIIAVIVQWHLPISYFSSTAILGGFMNAGIVIQIFTGYPVVALVALIRPWELRGRRNVSIF